MARRTADAENYWPGYVDALSTIVMVVTFLLIILGIVIASISQQTLDGLSDDSQANAGVGEFKKQQMIQGSQIPMDEDANEKIASAPIESDAVINRLTGSTGELLSGADLLNTGSDATNADDPDTDKALAVKAVVPTTSRVMTIARSEEVISEQKLTRQVVTATEFVTLIFDPETTYIDDTTLEELRKYLRENKAEVGNLQLAIYSYAKPLVGGVTEARRRAYKRALNARNVLLEVGFAPNRIRIRAEESSNPDFAEKVRIVLQD